MSGRTADDRAGRIADGTPVADPDAALAFSMEGAQGAEAPPALLTGYATPGLHSASLSYRFINGPGGPLKGGDPGVPLIVVGQNAREEPLTQPEPEGEGLLPLILHDPFTGTGSGARRRTADSARDGAGGGPASRGRRRIVA